MATFKIHPPTGGIVRKTGLQTQPPYTCVHSTNFWPLDVRDGVELTSTRPAQSSLTFPDYPINMLQQLNLPSPTAFAAANGILYKRDSTGTYNAISSSVGVSTGRAVYAAPYFKQMIIANNGVPLWYDDDAGTLVELTATAGFIPENFRLIMNFQGTVWGGGSPTDDLGPHVFYTHRFNEVQDWNFSDDDELAAYISTGEDRGIITSPLSAMVAITGDQAVLACEEEIWVMSGHPRRGGRFDRASNQTGVLGQNAWANTPKGFFFLSHDGLMFMARNDYANLTVTPVSKQKIPDALLNVDYDARDPRVCMSYSSRWNAIYLTVRDTVNPQAWMYYLETGGFYEMQIDEPPLVMFPFESLVTDDTCGVMFGGQALKQFDRTASETITASQVIGPVRISRDATEATIVRQVSVVFGRGTTDDDAEVSIFTGPTGATAIARAEANQDGPYCFRSTVGEIRDNSRNLWVNLRGSYIALRLDQDEATDKVVFEDLVGVVERGGINIDEGLVPPVVTPPTVVNLQIDDN